MNAAVPITGGMSKPPVVAAATMPPANSELYPLFLMRGIVNVPVAATFAVADPDTMPNSPLAMTAIFGAAPRMPPNAA